MCVMRITTASTHGGNVSVDFGAVMERMRRLRADISKNDSVKRYTEAGVDVFLGTGCFTGARTVEVAGQTLHFSRAVIATGGRAAVPGVPGLREAGYLTNETVFRLTERPARLGVIGGGPIGCELAQTFQRLGVQVTLLHTGTHLLNREDADAAEIVQQAIVHDGVEVILAAKLFAVERREGTKVLCFTNAQGQSCEAPVDEILVAAGREPVVNGLNLEAAGVTYDHRQGIQVNDRLQTTNPTHFRGWRRVFPLPVYACCRLFGAYGPGQCAVYGTPKSLSPHHSLVHLYGPANCPRGSDRGAGRGSRPRHADVYYSRSTR